RVRAGERDQNRQSRLFSPLVRRFLFRTLSVSRLPVLWRRIQGDGFGAVRRAELSRAASSGDPASPGRTFPIESEIFPTPHAQCFFHLEGLRTSNDHALSPRAGEASWSGASPGRAHRAETQRHCAFGPGHLRKSVFRAPPIAPQTTPERQ